MDGDLGLERKKEDGAEMVDYTTLCFLTPCMHIYCVGLSSVGILCGWDLHYGDQIGLVCLSATAI
jgi:hypothetical protein